ncbi:MAG: lipase family alpha/beta hydrolase [Solirubrobacteraceae bacterium]
MNPRRLLVLATLLAGFAAAAPAQAIPPFAQLWTLKPGIDPPGVNVMDCKPSAAHPVPVVLVHGTWMDRSISWNVIGPKLALDGYCVFSLDYGNRGTQHVADSAREVSAFIDDVRARTGAPRVSIVGHSQGGMLPRHIIKFLGGASKIDDLVAIAPSNHGSPESAFRQYAEEYGDSPAAGDQREGSPFLTALNAGDETPQPASGPRISYTNLATKNDEIVTNTPTSQFLAGSPDEVTNVLLQDKCPADQSEHVLLTDDPVVLQWVEEALAAAGPARPSFAPVCA